MNIKKNIIKLVTLILLFGTLSCHRNYNSFYSGVIIYEKTNIKLIRSVIEYSIASYKYDCFTSGSRLIVFSLDKQRISIHLDPRFNSINFRVSSKNDTVLSIINHMKSKFKSHHIKIKIIDEYIKLPVIRF